MKPAYKWLLGLIDPFAPADGPPPQRLWPFIKWALSGSQKAIALALVVTFTAGLSELVAASFTGWIIDGTASGATAGFWLPFWPVILFGLIFFLIVRPILFAADAGVTGILLGPHLFPLVLSRLNRHTLGHSMRYFENDFAGRISQKALQTSRALTDVVTEVADVGIYSLAVFGGSLVLMASIDARLLLIFVVWGALYVLALRYFIPRVKRRSAARAGARTQVTGQIVDTLANVAAVKIFAHNTFEDRATLRELESFRIKALDFGVLSSGFRMVLMTLGGMLPLFSILGALYLWTTGTATPGDIAMTAMVATRLSQLTNRMGRVAISIFTNLGEIQDGIDTLARAHEITDRPGAAESASGPGAIRFENIRFAYGGAVPALNDLSLSIRAGEKIGLVGASGAGKSTIVSLLLRLYEVEQGRILLDGTDIRDLTQEALRQRISVVRQEASMFNRSALDNIRYGRPDATEQDVIEAARRASADGFIRTLQDHQGRSGYGARLGERGVKLSGGQRQRIALARAILKDAPVLVLDEATSALDSEVEAEIQTALGQVMQGKTVIAIAHRLSTIAQMDRIIVLEQGRIAEMGSHSELLARKGLYARFWGRQSGGFLGAEAAAE